MSSATTADDLDVHAFLGDGTTLVDLGTLGGPSSETVAINAAGSTVGPAKTMRTSYHPSTRHEILPPSSKP